MYEKTRKYVTLLQVTWLLQFLWRPQIPLVNIVTTCVLSEVATALFLIIP